MAGRQAGRHGGEEGRASEVGKGRGKARLVDDRGAASCCGMDFIQDGQ